jgi:hypothetical protein
MKFIINNIIAIIATTGIDLYKFDMNLSDLNNEKPYTSR